MYLFLPFHLKVYASVEKHFMRREKHALDVLQIMRRILLGTISFSFVPRGE